MIETRIITRKQKKFLDETLCALGIDVNQLLLVNNLNDLISENKILKQENRLLNEKLDLLNKRIEQNEASVDSLNMKLQKSAFEAIWGDLDNGEEQTEKY